MSRPWRTPPRVRVFTLLILAVVLAGLVAGCGSSSSSSSSSTEATEGGGETTEAAAETGGGNSEAEGSETTAPESSAKPLEGQKIAYIQAGDIEYYELSAKGFSEAVESLGGSSEVFDSSFETTKELANVQDAIAKQVDGIVLFPLSEASAKSEIKLADNANIPISVLYSYSPELKEEAAGFVEVEFQEYAKALGEKFDKILPSGEVAIISGTPGRAEVTKFREGFIEGFGDESRVVDEVNGNYERQKAFNAAQDLLQKYPDLKGLVVGNEDMAIGAASALGSKLGQVDIATQNGSPEGNKFLEEGKFKVTVGASPSQEAALAVRLLTDTIEGSPAEENHCLTPWAINEPGHIRSVGWEPTPEIIAGALKQPPPCSSN
jgi:ribose transport system substrate-binding protein